MNATAIRRGAERSCVLATAVRVFADAACVGATAVCVVADTIRNRFSGVLIEGRRPEQNDWAPLGTDNYSPYVDTRPPLTPGRSETREYRLRYLDHDEPVGDYSDIISATTSP